MLRCRGAAGALVRTQFEPVASARGADVMVPQYLGGIAAPEEECDDETCDDGRNGGGLGGVHGVGVSVLFDVLDRYYLANLTK